MPDKIVNHFVLADGSVARYDYDGLVNVPFGDDVTEVGYETRGGYISSDGRFTAPSSDGVKQEVYTNKIPVFPNDVIYASFSWNVQTNDIWVAYATFDESGRFLSRVTPFATGKTTPRELSLTIPMDVYYIAFTYRSYGDANVSVNYKGSLFDIRNRKPLGLVKEDEWDYLRLTEADPQGFDVVKYGWLPTTGLVDVSRSKYVKFELNESYANNLYVGAIYYDSGGNGILYNDLVRIADNVRRFAIPTSAKSARFIFNNENSQGGTGSPTIDTIKQNVNIVIDIPEEPLTPIICGSGNTVGTVPAWDVANGTFTIPYDCIFFKNGIEVRPSYLMETSSPTVLTIPTGSTALRLYFDVKAKEYSWRTWDDVISNYEDLILVAVLRNYPSYPALSINSPYTINGKLYGIDTTAQVDFDAIAWAFNENVKGVNHRGYYTAPENTLPAYKLSKKNGFKYCECDVSMTSDRVPVLLHDNTINRTARNADGTEISETISIGSITYEQALQYDFGIYKGSQYAGTKIPTFEQFITLCRNLGLHPYIELKTSGYTEAEVQSLVDIVRQNGMDGKVTWISFNIGVLEYVKNYDASARLGFIVGALTSANITTASSLKTATNEVFLDVSSIADELVDDCITAGLPVEVWTINTTAGITALNDYISGVTSDNLIASKVLYEANI